MIARMNRRKPITIDERIERSGKSANAIAAEAGISPGYLSLIRNGHRQVGPETLVRLAQALNCKPADLRPDLAHVFAA